jgi:anti-anti-sigma factor
MSIDRPVFEVNDVASGDEHRLVLRGELDIATAPRLEAAVRALCEEPPSAAVLDLRELTFMDSSGLRAIVSASEACGSHGHELRIIPGPRNVQTVFELTGVAARLPFESSPEQHAPCADALVPKLFESGADSSSGSNGAPQS